MKYIYIQLLLLFGATRGEKQIDMYRYNQDNDKPSIVSWIANAFQPADNGHENDDGVGQEFDEDHPFETKDRNPVDQDDQETYDDITP